MPRQAAATAELKVWRVRGLRDLELERAERASARRAPHMHHEFEIAVLERGAQRLRKGGSSQVAPEGCVIVIPPGEVHAHDPVDADAASRSFFPDLAALVIATDRGGRSRAPAFRERILCDRRLARKISRLHRMLETPGSMLARETRAIEAATMLVDRHGGLSLVSDRGADEDNNVRRVREHLESAIAQNVSLAELTEITGLPSYTLVRAFARRMGMPPYEYHLHVRLNAAKRLLAHGEPASRVAFATGFVDQSHLTRHFRRVMGVTPVAYAGAVEP